VHEDAEEEGVDGGAKGLVEEGFEEGVALVEFGWSIRRSSCCFAVIAAAAAAAAAGGVGREGGLEEILPEEVGRVGDEGEEGVLEDGDGVDVEGGLC
jgi:hypothetical protein